MSTIKYSQVRTTEKIDYYKLSEGEIEGVTDNEVTAITADDEVFDVDDKIFATMNELLDHLQDNAHKFTDKESVKNAMGGYAKPF